MNKHREKLFLRLRSPAFYAAILGAIKLVSDAFGYEVISDEQVNTIANGLATLFIVVGVGISYN